jgi:hypothetical protein
LEDPRKRLLAELHPRIAFDLLRPLAELLSVARQVCGGDTDKFLILLVVGVRTTSHPAFKRFSHADLQAGKVAVMPSLGTNMRSIAASLGIPRETARRKLAELCETGWLVRRGRDVRLTAKGYVALNPVRERIAALALRNAALVDTLVARAASLASEGQRAEGRNFTTTGGDQ